MKFSLWPMAGTLVLASLLMILARWFHPATFNDTAVVITFSLGILLLVIQLLTPKHDR